MAWFLRNVKIKNLLGFFGSKEFQFGDGLHVIEAENHTGKSSFAIALLWGLTGQLPATGRISAGTFKLKNKLADDKETASLEITLENGQEKLIISRSTNSGAKTSILRVEFHEIHYTDAQAQELIQSILGLKGQSLEGCSVVLQDQRLSLITGDLKKSSEVIHDILGLSVLSKLVPIINEKTKELKKLIKDYEDLDPLKKWEARHSELSGELKNNELKAIAKGYSEPIFKTNFLEKSFHQLCRDLEIEESFAGECPKEVVAVLRKKINHALNQNPHRTKKDEFQNTLSLINHTLQNTEELKKRIEGVGKAYSEVVEKHGISSNEVLLRIQQVMEKIAVEDAELVRVKEQNALFAHSLALLQNQECTSCPLCQQEIHRQKLLSDIELQLGHTIKAVIQEKENTKKRLQAEKDLYDQLKRQFSEWHETLIQSLNAALNLLGNSEKYKNFAQWIQQVISEQSLNQIVEIASRFESICKGIRSYYQECELKYQTTNQNCLDYDQKILPLGNELDKIAMYLIPIHDIHLKLFEHDKQKNEKTDQSSRHAELLTFTQKQSQQLENFKTYLQNKEKHKANEVCSEHQNFVTDFFAKVANNPHYDRISIKSEIMHGSVKYDFKASSTKNASFTDAAKHVLSGGDLSVACLGLMLSLTKGKANKTGFMVLDDPGESLDAIRMDNFAREIQQFGNRQTIILTHQKDFADRLRQYGAESIALTSR